jgi:RNase adaptor protein for sRNA GlmZ degradation
MLRRYEDALVTRVPTPAEINRVKARWPDVIVQIPVQEGVRLSQLHDQDSYSYEIAVLFMGADNHQSLLEKYHQCRDMLPLEFASYSQRQPTA